MVELDQCCHPTQVDHKQCRSKLTGIASPRPERSIFGDGKAVLITSGKRDDVGEREWCWFKSIHLVTQTQLTTIVPSPTVKGSILPLNHHMISQRGIRNNQVHRNDFFRTRETKFAQRTLICITTLFFCINHILLCYLWERSFLPLWRLVVAPTTSITM